MSARVNVTGVFVFVFVHLLTILFGAISVLIAALMSTVYEEQKDEDGFLYVQYSGESTFG